MSDPRPSPASRAPRFGRGRARRGAMPTVPLPAVPLPAFIGSRLEAHPSFTRGLSLGLLVGAAVAGSTIWGRLRGDASRRLQDAGSRTEPGADPRTTTD